MKIKIATIKKYLNRTANDQERIAIDNMACLGRDMDIDDLGSIIRHGTDNHLDLHNDEIIKWINSFHGNVYFDTALNNEIGW